MMTSFLNLQLWGGQSIFYGNDDSQWYHCRGSVLLLVAAVISSSNRYCSLKDSMHMSVSVGIFVQFQRHQNSCSNLC